jgi:hypothetical protein
LSLEILRYSPFGAKKEVPERPNACAAPQNLKSPNPILVRMAGLRHQADASFPAMCCFTNEEKSATDSRPAMHALSFAADKFRLATARVAAEVAFPDSLPVFGLGSGLERAYQSSFRSVFTWVGK